MQVEDAEQANILMFALLDVAKGIEALAQTPAAIWLNPNLLTEGMSRIYNAREYMRERNAA